MTLKKKPVENNVEKGENAGTQHFSPFPTMFSTFSRKEKELNFFFQLDLFCRLQMLSIWTSVKFVMW